MANYKNILIASDLSLETLDLLDKARVLASEKAKITLIHAVPPIGFTYKKGHSSNTADVLSYEEIEKEILDAKQEHVVEMIEYHEISDIQWDIETGEPSKVIRERAELTNCDLIIFGLRNPLGSSATATGVLHNTPCDVLCIRH